MQTAFAKAPGWLDRYVDPRSPRFQTQVGAVNDH